MNRLTERKENGVINVRYATEHETAIHRLAAIEDILGDEYDLDELREMVQAKREGRCVVLPVVSDTTIKEFTEALECVFAEWNCYDPSVGLFGTSDEEKKLQDSIVAALRREQE